MPEYKAPLRDMRFLIDEVFDFHGRYQALGASDATPDMVAAILDEGSKFCEQVLAPLNRSGDEEGCHFDNGVVTTPRVSRKPMHSTSRVAGTVSPAIPRTAARACRTRWVCCSAR